MLTDRERAAFLESAERVKQLAASALGEAGVAERAVAFIGNLHRSIDLVVLRASETGPVPDCRAGCAYCCTVRVSATDPEILRIARRIRSLPPAESQRLVERLRAHVAERQAGSIDERIDCGFLAAGRCSIYEHRPAACRKAHSLSVSACESLSPEIPQNLKVVAEAEALMAGVSAAYREAKLPSSEHELNAAVLAVLKDPSAEQRWYSGEPVF